MLHTRRIAVVWPYALVTALFSLCIGAGPANADILYSARYYSRPGSHITTYLHLYRINPDGSRKRQLTFGQWNDAVPLWSPDGRRILFIREPPDRYEKKLHWSVCLIPAGGGRVRRLLEMNYDDDLNDLRWAPDGHTVEVARVHTAGKSRTGEVLLMDVRQRHVMHLSDAESLVWSPDGKWGYIVADRGDDKLMTMETGRAVPVSDPVQYPIWLDGNTLIGAGPQPDGAAPYLRVIGPNGKERRRITFTKTDLANLDVSDSRIAFLGTIPHLSSRIVCGFDISNSTVRPLYKFYQLDLKSAVLLRLTEGKFLEWAPDGQQFCVAPGRDVTPYDTLKNGHKRVVWVAPLQVGSRRSGLLRSIVSGLVLVTAAAWQPAAKPVR